MYPPSPPATPPDSYAKLDLPHIKISHVPESCAAPTPVLLLMLYRPQNNNAFTEVMRESIVTFYDYVNVDNRVKAIVITGYGKMFCPGADLDIGFTAQKRTERSVDHRDGGGRVALAIHQCSIPTIVAIQGHAVGVGATAPLAATIRVAYAKAKIGFPFGRRGIVMEASSHYFLPRLIGLSRAMHLTTTGALYPAEHPLMRELFSEILPTPEATVARALELADEIAKNTSTVSTKLMRDMMHYGPATAEEAHLLDSRIIHGLFGSKDNTEGVKSFFEKRPPQFTGSMAKDAPEAWPFWSQIDIGYVPKEKPKASKL